MNAPMLISNFGVARGELLRFVNAEGVLVHVRAGSIWLTQHGHGNDIVLRAGQTFELARPDLALAQALADDAALTVAVPERAKAAIIYLPRTERPDDEGQGPTTTPRWAKDQHHLNAHRNAQANCHIPNA